MPLFSGPFIATKRINDRWQLYLRCSGYHASPERNLCLRSRRKANLRLRRARMCLRRPAPFVFLDKLRRAANSTGKERDSESGLDNFGARYDASSMGRFMSPDWSARPTPVPFADLANPQSLNLYAYVLNNPLRLTDPDGHCIWDGCVVEIVGVAAAIGLGVYAYHHFIKKVDKGFNEARDASKTRQEEYDAAMKGDAEKADQKDDEATSKEKKALGTAAEATLEGMQLPGTSTGGDVGVKPEDGGTAIVTTVGLGAVTSSAGEKSSKNVAKDKQPKKQQQGAQNPPTPAPPPQQPCERDANKKC